MFVFSLLLCVSNAWDRSKAFPLHNAAVPGLTFPWVGLGTGGYGFNNSVSQPECWSELAGCGERAQKAIIEWLEVGGPRVDDANTYYHQNHTGFALRDTKVPREDFFYLTKVGPPNPLGYEDTMAQVATMKAVLHTRYVDALLIHWPQNGKQGSVAPIPSKDAACQTGKP
eukprot:386228_1